MKNLFTTIVIFFVYSVYGISLEDYKSFLSGQYHVAKIVCERKVFSENDVDTRIFVVINDKDNFLLREVFDVESANDYKAPSGITVGSFENINWIYKTMDNKSAFIEWQGSLPNLDLRNDLSHYNYVIKAVIGGKSYIRAIQSLGLVPLNVNTIEWDNDSFNAERYSSEVKMVENVETVNDKIIEIIYKYPDRDAGYKIQFFMIKTLL